MNKEEDHTTEASGENGISHAEINQKLAIFYKDSKIKKFFEENKCLLQ